MNPDRVAALLVDPGRIAELSPADAAATIVELAALQSAIAARLAVKPAPTPSPVAQSRSRWFTADQAAERLGVTRRWIYAHAHELDGQRLSRKCLRIPQRAVEHRLADKRT